MFKKMMIPALVLAATSVAIPAAAQSYGGHNQGGHGSNRPPVSGPSHNNWQSINQRQAQLDRRIDQGVRNGQLSRREATRLRSEFNSLARLETQYRRGGLSAWERNDLDRRFDRLSAQIRNERNDRDNRRH
jgi:hypothetical protein